MIKLCPKHYTNTPFQILVQDETDCKFCRIELEERMKKFGYIDWQQELIISRDKYIK